MLCDFVIVFTVWWREIWLIRTKSSQALCLTSPFTRQDLPSSQAYVTELMPWPMSGNMLANAISLVEMNTWARVIKKRRAEWIMLPRDELLSILKIPLSSKEKSSPSMEDLCRTLEWVLIRNFSQSINRKFPPHKRRASLKRLERLLRKLDEAHERRNTENWSLNTKLCSDEEIQKWLYDLLTWTSLSRFISRTYQPMKETKPYMHNEEYDEH